MKSDYLDSAIKSIYLCALVETNLLRKTLFARSLLSLLYVRVNKSDSKGIEDINSYIEKLDEEIKKIEIQRDGTTYEELWKITNRVVNYATGFVFENNMIQDSIVF
jgi:hypothetical protein